MKGKGWTLLELLIVVGIILALIGLMTGAVRMASEVKTKAQCMNNLHQLYLASKMYEQDFGEPPMHYGQFLAWQPSLRPLLICPKDPTKGFGVGGWYRVHEPDPNDPNKAKCCPNYVPHSYSPQYWGAYWVLKGKIKIYANKEKVEQFQKRMLENKDYFICGYHMLTISIDGQIRKWNPKEGMTK